MKRCAEADHRCSFPRAGRAAPALHRESPGCCPRGAVFADGADTDKVADVSSCSKDGSLHFVFSDRTECTDGTRLFSNEFGWGFSGKKWNVSTSGVIPIGTCTGLKADKCSDAFAPGVITDKEWTSGTPQCIGDDGRPTSVFLMALPCFKSSKEYISNEFGWGYVGEPWQKGDPPSDC